MSKANSSYHHGDLKAALLSAAEAILKEQGFQALSLRTIAGKAGVSHMAPYAHFRNKSDLFQSIAAAGFNAMADRMEALDVALPPEERILAYGAQYIEFALANAPLYRLMLAQIQETGPDKAGSEAGHLSEELKQASKRPYDLLEREFSRLIKDKALRKIRTQGAWSMVHGMAALIIDGHLSLPDGMSVKTFLSKAAIH